MATLRFAKIAATVVVAGVTLASVLQGCSSSSDQTGGPLGNPDCDGGTCDDSSIPLDSSSPDVQFDVDTQPPDTKGSEAPPSETASDAPTDG